MAPTLQLPREAARLWTDPAVRARIVAMHRDDVPLLEMIDALGLTGALEADGLRDVIAGLDPSEVATIRDAFVAEATATSGVGAHFPVDCRIDDVAAGVAIVAADARGADAGTVARILPA